MATNHNGGMLRLIASRHDDDDDDDDMQGYCSTGIADICRFFLVENLTFYFRIAIVCVMSVMCIFSSILCSLESFTTWHFPDPLP